MNHLPDDIIKLIWKFDDTYRQEYKKCMDQIEKSREEYNKLITSFNFRAYQSQYEIDRYTYLKFTFNEYLKRQSYYRMAWIDRMLLYDRRVIVPCPDL